MHANDKQSPIPMDPILRKFMTRLSNERSKLLYVVLFALAIKTALCVFSAVKVPQAKVLVDSHVYLETARTLAFKGVFGQTQSDGGVAVEILRTPGYPLFLAVFHHYLKIPLDGIIMLQILMTVAAALICAKTASLIDERFGFLTAVILLFDLSVTVYSMLILTESLFFLLLSVFLYFSVVYFKDVRLKWAILAALTLAAAVYVRPIGFYLGIVVAVFLAGASWKTNAKRALVHAFVFIMVVYATIGLWLMRNYAQGVGFNFTSVDNAVASTYGLIGGYERHKEFLPTKLQHEKMWYINATGRGLATLMTKPGSLKYFGSKPLKVAGKVFGYPFNLFVLAGLLIGITRCQKHIPLLFVACVLTYFIGVSLFGVMWREAARFRVSMMPFIAILSAYGWVSFREHLAAQRLKK
jgi:4-amino-4-deoxy-L-arabinose transferase-like glycosyltransferase